MAKMSMLGLSAPLMPAAQYLSDMKTSLKSNGKAMPALFIGHGSPTNGIESNEFSNYWTKLAEEIPRPKAILCISAHWLTRGTAVTAMKEPKTIHDFGNFSQELYDVQYSAPGDPVLAGRIKTYLAEDYSIGMDHDWGMDHGCWTIARQMYPDADIPVLQMSIDYHKPAQYHYELGKQLAYLRKKGVLILGSGNMVHNLRKAGAPKGMPLSMSSINSEFGYDWALEIDEKFKKLILSKEHESLINYEKLGKAARLAIPTPDHYFPMLYALALQGDREEIDIFNDKCVGGSISMTSFRVG